MYVHTTQTLKTKHTHQQYVYCIWPKLWNAALCDWYQPYQSLYGMVNIWMRSLVCDIYYLPAKEILELAFCELTCMVVLFAYGP